MLRITYGSWSCTVPRLVQKSVGSYWVNTSMLADIGSSLPGVETTICSQGAGPAPGRARQVPQPDCGSPPGLVRSELTDDVADVVERVAFAEQHLCLVLVQPEPLSGIGRNRRLARLRPRPRVVICHRQHRAS